MDRIRGLIGLLVQGVMIVFFVRGVLSVACQALRSLPWGVWSWEFSFPAIVSCAIFDRESRGIYHVKHTLPTMANVAIDERINRIPRASDDHTANNGGILLITDNTNRGRYCMCSIGGREESKFANQ